MKPTIDQFMWGFQQHFRSSVEYEVKGALERIGLPVDARVLLVGFATEGGNRHRTCVEPEDGALTVEHLSQVDRRAAEILVADPESRIVVSDSRHRALRHQGLVRRARANALVEAIEFSGVFPDLQFFASAASPIGGYEVHTCIGVHSEVLQSLPAFDEDFVDRVYVGRSLLHEVLAECLRRCDAALYLPDPGAGLYVLNARTDEVVREAARRFVDGMVYRLTEMPADLYQSVSAFVSLGYERAAAGGHLVVQQMASLDELCVRFRHPIRLRDARIMRKLLELSDGGMSVVTDGRSAHGLGDVTPSARVAEIAVLDHATWQVSVDGSPLVRVAYGVPSLPRPFLSKQRFEEIANRVVGENTSDAIWRSVEAAQSARHGTTIVVSVEPNGEVTRLGGQAVPIEPAELSEREVARLGRVDGAVLLGTDARCYAFGVILDGTAVGAGDPARGSRYNSAVRYQRTAPAPALAVVVSDDGTVDLIPDLRPRVRREDVDAAVQDFLSVCEDDEVDGEVFARAHDKVMRLAFYLNLDQCQRVTAAYEAEMQRRLDAGGIALGAPDLRPDPDMNDSYFLSGQ